MTARGRRFAEGLDPLAAEMNASVGFDWRLLPHDVAGSIAHARMLARQGIIPAADADRIIAGLREVEKELRDAEVPLDPALEDIHMNVEARLTARIGEAGARLHTARSRNDQVATDLRLYALASAGRIVAAIDGLRRALVAQARQHLDTLAPGYTHLQRAQPVRLAHHLLAYVAMLDRDRGRVLDAARRADVSPLGAGALAATTFPIDREGVARDLGFSSVTSNSLDAVGNRDFAVELCAAAALAQAHLSRLGEELVLWASSEFAFVELPEGYCSGSSIMPQKKNPDIAELVRAKAGRVIGDLVTLLTVLKGLPLAYNKDLQETQEPLYDAVETVAASLEVMVGLVGGLRFRVERLARAVGEGHLVATELADYLAAKGVPFRRAHDVAGALVRKAVERGVELAALPLAELQAEAAEFADDVYSWLDPARAVDRRDVPGGPARARVLAEIERLEKELTPMNHFQYQGDELFCEAVPLAKIAREVGTPTYVYSHATLERHLRVFDEAFAAHDHLVCYSVKANSNLAILRALFRLGAGADIVSAGELFRALRAGCDPQKIVFSGVGKRADEIEYALETGILCFNVESEGELVAIEAVAAKLGTRAPIALRVNPDVDAETHPYISTGLKKNKFGISVDAARRAYQAARQMPHLWLRGIDCHIGSQLTKTAPFRDAIGRVAELARELAADGVPLELLDVGGGLGIPYQEDGEEPPSPADYAAAVGEAVAPFAGLGLRLVCEPGRVIVGNAGVLLSRVLYLKQGEAKSFTIVNAAFNDLIRPAFYGSFHGIKPVVRRDGPTWVTDVVGPICETGDFLARDREMRRAAPGNLLAIMSAGAYGFTMASNYNSRPRAAEVLVQGDRYSVVRRREELEDVVRGEHIPDWLP